MCVCVCGLTLPMVLGVCAMRIQSGPPGRGQVFIGVRGSGGRGALLCPHKAVPCQHSWTIEAATPIGHSPRPRHCVAAATLQTLH